MALSILTDDKKNVSQDFQSFLRDESIGSDIKIETTTGPGTNITSFVAEPGRFFNLKFSSAANITRFPLAATSKPSQNTVLLSLEQGVPWDGSLGQILTAFIGAPAVPETGIVAKVLTSITKALADQVPVTLVNPKDRPETRNGIWCVAGQTRVISTALIFELNPAKALKGLRQTLQDELEIDLAIDLGKLAPLNFHLQRTSYGIPRIGRDEKLEWSIRNSWSLTIQITINGFDFWLQQDSGETSVILTQNKNDKTDIWTKLKALGGADEPEEGKAEKNKPPSSQASQPSGPDIPAKIDLLSISLGRNLTGKLWWQIKTVFQWELGAGKGPVLIGLSYSSIENSFVGELLTRDSFQSDKSLITYRPSADVAPPTTVEVIPEVLFLSDLFPEAASLPAAVPNAISAAQISYSGDKTRSLLGLQATLVRAQREDAVVSDVPCPFSWDSLSIYAQRSTTVTPPPQPGGKSVKTSQFVFGAAATFTLNPREEDKALYSPASLSVSIDYNDGDWRANGHVEDLHFGVLVGFMDKDEGVRNSALDILSKLSLTELDVLFTYNKTRQPASFLITGTITLGSLELRLFYQYVGASKDPSPGKSAAEIKRRTTDPPALPRPQTGATWQLRAYLGASGGKKASLGEIIDSIAGEEEGSDVIPDFIKNIEIEPAESGANSAVSMEVSKNDKGAVVFVLSVNVMGIKFSYMQIGTRARPTTGGGLSSGTSIATQPQTTRILRITIDKLPLIKDIPLVSQLGQPFDRMLYLYVSGTKGLLQHELDAINAAVTSDSDRLVAKRAVAKPSLTAPVINKGHHFMIIQNGDVILDHVFGIGKDETSPSKKPTDPNSNKPKPLRLPSATTPSSPPPATSNTPTKGSLTQSLGPLTISALTLEYKSRTLWIYLDATLTLGPLSLTLLGFGIGLLTSGLQLNNLSTALLTPYTPPGGGAPQKRLTWDLRGMSLAFDRPPLLIAGMFEYSSDAKGSSYKGGVGIGFPPYTFVGVGEYQEVRRDAVEGGDYKSIFLFAKLDGPLVTLEFATISGVRLGFGFNSLVKSPKIEELTEFPFVKNASADGAGGNPMAILKSMTPGWVTPREGSYWLAAGMTVTAFDVIAVTAVAMFAFRDSGVVISIFADAVAQLPPHVPDPAGVILYVEMGLVAEMNFIDGYFRVEASLAPSSYLLVPQCRLTGGFALAYWFGNNPNAGDWVFSVGGYHRAFKPPPYYPVPARLGISFTIGDTIQMRGESYFAITPKAAMAGALIHVSLSIGPISAYLDASFDALINFHPFHYIVEFSVSIGVECTIDILFITIHISIHIGAELHIEGPEFGGVAHVDFWFFGFDIEFGARIGQPPPLELLEFWKTTHQPGPGTPDRQDVDANPVQAKLIYEPDFKPPPPALPPLPPNSPPRPPPPPPKIPETSIIPNAAFKFILEQGNFPMSNPTPSPSPTASPTASPDTIPSTGAGATWYVKGGSLRLGITTAFPLSFILIPGTTDAPRTPTNPWGGQPSGGRLPTENVYANPMHVVEPITSSLTVTIRRVNANGTVGGVVPLWRDVEPIRKAVPVAMWDRYDPGLDVMARGPRAGPPASLLDGSEGATRMQTLGVSLSAPWPVISMARIPKFRASAMARLGVVDMVVVGREMRLVDGAMREVDVTEGRDWYIPGIEEVQTKFLGGKLSVEEREMDGPTRWEKFEAQWRGFVGEGEILDEVGRKEDEGDAGKEREEGNVEKDDGDGNGDEGKKEETDKGKEEPGILGMAAEVLGWSEDTNRLAGEVALKGESPSWLLSGKPPKKLINGLTDFYLALPRVCV